jgi:hypothetical protein
MRLTTGRKTATVLQAPSHDPEIPNFIETLRDKTFGQTVEIFPLCCNVCTSHKALMVALQLLVLERFRIYR